MTEDGMCKSCKNEYKIKNIESRYHATYECRMVKYIYNQILAEFELENDNIPLYAGSGVLITVLDSTPGSQQMSELINVIWSMAMNCILTARNAKLTPGADIIINYIKTSLIHVVPTV